MWVEINFRYGRKEIEQWSSSSWGCELKLWRNNRALYRSTVILFVRMWVEIYCQLLWFLLHKLSSSSWGCELKWLLWFTINITFCHPLREDVSWNIPHSSLSNADISHPLREDVSWNVMILMSQPCEKSSSSWGCELKYFKTIMQITDNSHPLREDVSWNELKKVQKQKWVSHPLREDVSWNNVYVLSSAEPSSHPLREDVSWNAWFFFFCLCEPVILFVRMWVEMLQIV